MSEHEDDELGTPIAELSRLREQPSNDFMGRVRRSIQRRSLAGQLVELSWNGMGEYLRELLDVSFGMIGSKEEEGGQDG